VSQAYDAIGRLSQISNAGSNLLSNLQYNGAHQPEGFTYGNGVAAEFSYNSRMQLQSLAYRDGATNLFKLTYNYGSGNNGQIQAITDEVESGRSVSYTYDAWHRLKTAETTGSTNFPAWGRFSGSRSLVVALSIVGVSILGLLMRLSTP
jgi:YD repeat-containing protein